MKLTKKTLRRLIKEEVQLMRENKGKTLDGEALPVVRLVGPKGLGGVAKGGQNVIITGGWGGTAPNQFQLHVLPPGKVIGHYDSVDDALKHAMTGERYYASSEEILANSMADTAQPGSAKDSTVTVRI